MSRARATRGSPAHAPAARRKQHNGVQFYLGLLSTEYWQESALDSLLVWMTDEPSHVAKFMSSPQGIQQLQVECDWHVTACQARRASSS